MPKWIRVLGAVVLPLVALAAMLASWHRELPGFVLILLGALMIGAVLAAVHHAEVVAHKVGEPFGSIVLAVAVTIIEVALIITLSTSEHGSPTLARDTVFAAAIITCNGIAGLSILIGSIRHGTLRFNTDGATAALMIVITLTTLTLIVPDFTVSEPGPEFTSAQLGFVAVAALLLYVAFVYTQSARHRPFYLPVSETGDAIEEEHEDVPSTSRMLTSLALLLVSLVAVVGIAEGLSPVIESSVRVAGIPDSFVGVIIAFIVLLPESITAIKAAWNNKVQTSLNLAYGSAMASIGLTIPTIAVVNFWLPGPLVLGLDPIQIVLFGLTALVATLTVIPGRATRLQGFAHVMILASFVFFAIRP